MSLIQEANRRDGHSKPNPPNGATVRLRRATHVLVRMWSRGLRFEIAGGEVPLQRFRASKLFTRPDVKRYLGPVPAALRAEQRLQLILAQISF